MKPSVTSQSSTSRRLLPLDILLWLSSLAELHHDYWFRGFNSSFLHYYIPSAFPFPVRPTRDLKFPSSPHLLSFLTHQPYGSSVSKSNWSCLFEIHILGVRLCVNLHVSLPFSWFAKPVQKHCWSLYGSYFSSTHQFMTDNTGDGYEWNYLKKLIFESTYMWHEQNRISISIALNIYSLFLFGFRRVCGVYRIVGTFSRVNFCVHHYMSITEIICDANFPTTWPVCKNQLFCTEFTVRVELCTKWPYKGAKLRCLWRRRAFAATMFTMPYGRQHMVSYKYIH